MRRAASVLMCLVMVTSVFVVLPVNVNAAVLHVGSGWPYAKIQDAINAADPGDIVYVHPGTYNENVVIDKTINLTGEDVDTTIINGGGSDDVIYVSADYVNITGFTVTNGGPYYGDAGIELDSDFNYVYKNNASDNGYWGIYMRDTTNNTLFNNSCNSNNDNGIIFFYSPESKISNNSCNSNDYAGIYFERSPNSTITNNTCESNDYYGIDALISHNITISNNTCYTNWYHAIGVYWSLNCTIVNNTCTSIDRNGIYLEEASDSHVLNNTCNSNGEYGIELDESPNCTISDNICNYNDLTGISLAFSSNCIISKNICDSDSEEFGIYFYRSLGITMIDNTMISNGLHIDGSTIKHFNTHTIDSDNTLNGKPIYYWKNTTGGKVPEDAGQVILANCTGVTVENQNCSNGCVGIYLAYSDNNLIKNNTCDSNSISGIEIFYSDGNTLDYNN